jgi:glycosyltransferase involved in cell wall biosynthesis
MKVSICITTYNHEKYITMALDSVLMQRIDFEYEILVGEDQSSDTTRDIVTSYRTRHPDLRLFLHNYPEKYIRINGRTNFLNNLTQANGEYIALLDGDDYWTDPLKIQKQVNYLDNHPECSAVFHWADWVKHGKVTPGIYGPPVVKYFYTTDDLLEHSNFIPTCSAMFRREIIDEIPDWIGITPYADLPLHVLSSLRGKIGFQNESMGAYREHKGSLHTGSSRIYQVMNNFICFEIMAFHLDFYENPNYKKYMRTVRIELEELVQDKRILIEAINLIKSMSNRYHRYSSIVDMQLYLIKSGLLRSVYRDGSGLTIGDAIVPLLTNGKLDDANALLHQYESGIKDHAEIQLNTIISSTVIASVVICTYNRSDLLAEAIRSIEAQIFPKEKFEIIVVDNNSTDQTKETIKKLVQTSSVIIKYIFEPEQGLSNARNAGIKSSEGAIVAFVDDDVEVSENWLAEIVGEFLNPKTACVGGPVRPVWLAPKPDWLTGQWACWLTLCDYGWAENTRILTGPCYPVGANMAFRRDVFAKVGYFNSELGRIGNCLLSNEESRLCSLIEAAGLSIRLAPKAVAYHKIPVERLTKPFFYKRMYWQGISDAIMYVQLNKSSFSLLFNLIKSARKAFLPGRNSFSQSCHYNYFSGYFKGLLEQEDLKNRRCILSRILRTMLKTFPRITLNCEW